MNRKEAILNLLSALFITLIVIFSIFTIVGCSFITITTHQLTKLVDNEKGKIALTRGSDTDITIAKDNIDIEIPLLK